MKPLSEDPLLKDLAALPVVPLDPEVAEGTRREARAALVDGPPPSAVGRVSLVWSQAVLPAMLLASGAAYAWSAVQMLARVYIGG